MVRDFGVGKLEAKHFRQLFRMYAQKIPRLRRALLEPAAPLTDEDRALLEEKIRRLKQKARAVMAEFLRRVELKLEVKDYEDPAAFRFDLHASCPRCGETISLIRAVELDKKRKEIYLKCYKCGAESKRLSI